MTDFGLYLVITNPVTSYEKVAEAAVGTGVRIIQLRMKHTPRTEIVRVAKNLRSITANTSTCFIVNDDPTIAAEVAADGVHVGQTDMTVGEVRAQFPTLQVVGLSTHSLAQAHAAIPQKPDYIGVGPVWATPTKDIPDPTLGIPTAIEMIRAVSCPAVAIGGVDAARLPALVEAGARNFAVVRAVCQSPAPAQAIRQLQEIYENSLNHCRQ